MPALWDISRARRVSVSYLHHRYIIVYSLFIVIVIRRWEAIPRTQLYDEILSVIYRSSHSWVKMEIIFHGLLSLYSVFRGNPPCQTSSHAAGLLFTIFALATALDPKSEPYSLQALEYFLLSRVCLRFDSPVYETTLWAIQAFVSFLAVNKRVCWLTRSLDLPNNIFTTLRQRAGTHGFS